MPNIARHHGQIGMWFQKIAEPHDIERHDLVACFEKFGDEHAPLVPASARQKDFHSFIPKKLVVRAN
jgi:hypothetical protein